VAQGYDVIGDIHGHADSLVGLLKRMGYQNHDGAWKHSERQAIFVGDFIDLGPKQVEAVMLVKGMVEAGSALAVLGNHDLNAIAWYLPDPDDPSDYLRSHFSQQWGKKNRKQHAAFLAAVEDKPELHKEIIEWFLTLPLWLDLPGLRIVHACWHPQFMEFLTPLLVPRNRLSEDLMPAAVKDSASAAEKNSGAPSVFTAVEALTKGLEIPLPEGSSFKDKYGIERTSVRVCWWNRQATTYQDAAMIDDSLRESLSNEALPKGICIADASDRLTFIGHYWLTGKPAPLTNKVACVDYSVGHGGPLVAYRWEGENSFNQQNFCCVPPD
jgi:hypothetical protein